MKLIEIIINNLIITVDELKNDVELIIDIQRQLNAWGVYPDKSWIDGDYGFVTDSAFQKFVSINKLKLDQEINQNIATALLNPNTNTLIEEAKNKEQVFQIFLDSELGFDEDNLRIRDSKIEGSIYQNAIASYPNRLIQKPDNISIISSGKTYTRSNRDNIITFDRYPDRGIIPNIDNNGLNFLHEDIKEACVCLGSFVDGQMYSHWLGKNALQSAQFWSATKFIPLLNIASQLNSTNPQSDIDNCIVKSSNQAKGIPLSELAIDLVSYSNNHGSSNAIAAMFKRFESYADLDKWTSSITGNDNLTFKGRYGENDFYATPQLYDQQLQKTVLQSKSSGSRGQNLVSAYDLTRLITMLGWHYHLPSSARLPAVEWYSLATIIRAMGYDRARYLDFAIVKLGLQKVIKDPVIISKVGWEDSDERGRYEIV